MTGGFLLASALGGQVGAVHALDGTQQVYRVKQGSREFEITLLEGDTPVRELYDLRIPDAYGGDNGATDPGEGPYYESLGLKYLLEAQESVMFLYHGPDGVSLVALHGGPGDGTAVTWRVTGVPSGAKWLVKDDLYTYPETGEPAVSNYDQWNVSGSQHVIDWTWAGGRTDGGVLGYLNGDFSITIDPAYNTAATLYGEYFAGVIAGWYVLTGSWGNLTREELNLQEPVTISCETIQEPEVPGTPQEETPEETPTETPEEETPEETPEESPEESPAEETPTETPEEKKSNEKKKKKNKEEKEKPEWKEDRDEAREEWKEDRDEWQKKRDNGDDDWKEARDEAREERKEKRDKWQDKRDKEKEKERKKREKEKEKEKKKREKEKEKERKKREKKKKKERKKKRNRGDDREWDDDDDDDDDDREWDDDDDDDDDD
ncbi:hypothetical protein [Haloferax sp. CBA1149]|uniref:Uncharacterized protein n=2 Tax=Haloferax TaxID=2251 RepID=A0A6G1YYI8_9EURY|nr:hypothetical protein [Haloferax sp. CBA1149]KAB1186701.1 hypothetical protein Hfx1149_01130 [Haloferax sp. CBA1149]MRW79323.1 hypothetical protein [Haloferax marinisediminis]